MVIFRRKLCVDRQPDRCAVFVAGQLDREFHMIGALFTRLHIPRELFRRKQLFKQRTELHFAPAAAHLHICQDFLKSANVASKLLHRAKPLMNLLKPIAYQLKRFAQPFFQCAL